MAGNAEVMQHLNKIKLPYNINFFSEQVARTALQHRNELTEGIKLIIEERAICKRFLKTLPLTVYPSAANFILIRTDRKQALFDALLADGILVRDVSSYPMLQNCLRISIGSPEENRLFQQSMERFFITG
jgi:histidinol-phosphate aminotransferase